jgi:hypothetical protein
VKIEKIDEPDEPCRKVSFQIDEEIYDTPTKKMEINDFEWLETPRVLSTDYPCFKICLFLIVLISQWILFEN